MDSSPELLFSSPIALFPLPNCVLLPRAVLPLHIFEPRYREMVADCLRGSPFIAMALLEPGYEEKYYTKVAAIAPIVCVGQILRHEELADGRYNILLQGSIRARVSTEDRTRSYRRGLLTPLPPTGNGDPMLETSMRRELLEALASPGLASLSQQCNWIDMVKSTELPVSDVVDYLAQALVCDVSCARKFLEEPDVVKRFTMLLAAVKDISDRALAGASAKVKHWPRATPQN